MAAPQIVQSNPNATASVGSGGIGVLAVWLLNKYASAGLSPEEGVLVAGGITAAVLLIGRKGLRAVFVGWWKGAP